MGVVYYTDDGRTNLTRGSLEEHRLAARHSLLNAKGTGSLSLVSRTVNRQGLLSIPISGKEIAKRLDHPFKISSRKLLKILVNNGVS